MHNASLEAHTTLNTCNLWKFALRDHLNTDARTRDRTREVFDHKNDTVTARPQLHYTYLSFMATVMLRLNAPFE